MPGDYTGNFVEILHPASLQALEVKGAPGQRFILEDVEPTPSVPTLSEWGMGVLVAILLLTGIWMIKRRRRFQTA